MTWPAMRTRRVSLPHPGPVRSRPAGAIAGRAAELLASLQAALGVDVAQVVFDGLAADEQLDGDR